MRHIAHAVEELCDHAKRQQHLRLADHPLRRQHLTQLNFDAETPSAGAKLVGTQQSVAALILLHTHNHHSTTLL